MGSHAFGSGEVMPRAGGRECAGELSTCRIGKGEYRSRVHKHPFGAFFRPEPSMTKTTWKETLEGKIPPAWGEEIDVFETQIHLRKQGRIEEKLFAETRLRR